MEAVNNLSYISIFFKLIEQQRVHIQLCYIIIIIYMSNNYRQKLNAHNVKIIISSYSIDNIKIKYLILTVISTVAESFYIKPSNIRQTFKRI